MDNSLGTEIMAQKYRSILKRMEGVTFSWNTAVRLVGGRKRLERLMQEEKVRFEKPCGAANTRWQFAANDILSNVKPLAISEVKLS